MIMETIFPYLHIVSDKDVVHIKHLFAYKNIKQFKKDIQTLCRRYKPISLSDIIENRKFGRNLTQKSFLLTFDDGFREIHDIIAPILTKEGIPATFFLIQEFLDNKNMFFDNKKSLLIELCQNDEKVKEKVEPVLIKNRHFNATVVDSLKSVNYQNKQILDTVAEVIGYDFSDYLRRKEPYLTTDQITDLLNKGFTIGGHSLDHPKYSTISLKEQLRQTIISVQYLRDRFSLNYGAFAFPHSDAGVSKEFFSKIFSSGIIDITFGTAGIIQGCMTNHIQRFSAEKPLWPVSIILQKQKLKKFIRSLKKNNTDSIW